MMDLLYRLLLIVYGWLRAEACSLPIAIGSLRVASFLPRSLLVRHRSASGPDHVPSAAWPYDNTGHAEMPLMNTSASATTIAGRLRKINASANPITAIASPYTGNGFSNTCMYSGSLRCWKKMFIG